MPAENLVPTTKLRFIMRHSEMQPPFRILQQWWAQDMPAYMRDKAIGEWRDVELVEE